MESKEFDAIIDQFVVSRFTTVALSGKKASTKTWKVFDLMITHYF
jgi:hypothetical protein